jgi:DNA-binding NtrC family response regulator
MEKENQVNIMLVDDEEMVTISISSFLKLETDYNIICYNNPFEALTYLNTNKVNVVISDYLMPDMNGIEFLNEVRKVQPFSPRILLTGYADKENAIKAINIVSIYHYIEKPWDNNHLVMTIRNALEKQTLIRLLQDKTLEVNKAYSDLQIIRQELTKHFG